MHRRYTIHKDGDLLVEELDDKGVPIEPEPVPEKDRLPVEVIVKRSDAKEAHAQLLELLELTFGLESDGPPAPPDPGKFKLDVL